MKCNATRAQEGPPKLTDKRRSLKRKENWRKLLLLGIQTGDKSAKPPFFVAYSRLCRHCGNLAKRVCLLSPLSLLFGSCRLSEFTLAGSLNWSGKVDQKQDKRCYFYLFIHLLSIFYLSFCNPPGTTCKQQNIDSIEKISIMQSFRRNID